MFTDIVGYTALTQRDEALSMSLLEEHRALVRPFFAKHSGREVKTIGDAFLVEFDSALEAVRCAYDMQQSLHELNNGRQADKKVQLRIGIHLGDVIHSQGDVYGDAVNVASRIEPLAPPGGICISEQVYSQVKNKLEFPMVSSGQKELKNVGEAVEVFRIVLPWEKEDTAGEASDTSRVAVLPFANMSPDANDEYFADGMTEELIDRLAQVKGIEVIARTSVMNYKGEKKSASQIGRELRAGALVEGSVRKAGNRVRVTAQLIKASTEGHLWSSHYDGNLDDIFAVQSEIAEKVAGELKVQLLGSEKTALEKRVTVDSEAYMYYLRGRQLIHQPEETPLRNALNLFEQAMARDTKFAKAQASVAECYIHLANEGYIHYDEGIQMGRAAALKAVELDPALAEAHYSLAFVMFTADEDRDCIMELRKAIELNPNLVDAHLLLADESSALGDTQEMIRSAEKGYELDPLAPRAITLLGLAYFWTGRADEALAHWSRAIHLEPYRTNRLMFDYYVSKGSYGEAEKAVKELERLGPTLGFTYLNRGYLAALTGDMKTARDMIAKLDKGAGWGRSPYAGYIYYAMGDMDKFFEYMLRSAEDHTMPAQALRYSPLLEKARKDPRLGEAFRRAGLPYGPQS
jgi:TolB-like protein/Flp pilus assembly protein TadD